MNEVAERQQQAQAAIAKSRVLTRLAAYTPTVVSTIFVGLDTEDSDIDVICYCVNAPRFLETAVTAFGNNNGFEIVSSPDPIIVRFNVDGFAFEVYACDTPIMEQYGYRHYRIMERLVKLAGKPFQNAVRLARLDGLKTEAAIAQILGLKGDPYHAVLSLERWDDQRILEALH